MKRVLSLVLVLAMVLGTIMPAFAETVTTTAAASTEATELLSYGVIAGTDKGLEEEKVLYRAEFAVILSQLYGQKDTAEAYELMGSFTDLTEGAWYVPYVSYAEKMAWMSGDAFGSTFRPLDVMSAQEVNAMHVKALGYTVAWEEVNAKALELGVAVVAADPTAVLRGEEFKAFRMMLDVPKMGMTETLGTTLGLPNYVAPVVVPVALEVVSVTALNLIQLEVVFNQEITEAGDDSNYSLTDDNENAMIDEDSDFELLSDGKTVVITMTDAAEQQDVESLEVTGIKTEAGLKVVAFETEVTFLDTTIPTVVGAEVVGNDTIKVIFSEPMKATDKENFEVNSTKKLYIKSAKLQNNGTEALVVLYSDLVEGDLTVKVLAKTQDYAGFGVTPVTKTLTVVEDIDAPVVIGFKDATPNGVTLIWSEDIEIADGDFEGFYHTNSKNPIDADLTDADIDGNEMTLKFIDHQLPQGTAYVYVLEETVNDLWDNENTDQVFAVEVVVDVTKPEVDGDIDVISETEIEISFTEDMDEESVEDEENYTLIDEDGDEVDEITSVTAIDTDTISILFGDTLSGNYTLVLEDLEDIAGNEIVKVTLSFNADDLTAPLAEDFTAKIYNPLSADQMIRINFADTMEVEGAYSILDAAKYTFNVGTDTEFTLDEIDEDLVSFDLVNDGKSVEITVPSVIDDAVEGINVLAGIPIHVGRVSDVAGNLTKGVYNVITADRVINEGTIATPTAVATELDTIEMTFEEEVAALEISDFEVQNNDVKVQIATIDTDLDEDGNTVVTFTLDVDMDATATGMTVEAVTATSQNAYGEFITTFEIDVEDEIAPELDYIEFVNSGLIKIYFNEMLDATLFATSGMNGFTVTNGNTATIDAVNHMVVNVTPKLDKTFTVDANVSYNGTNGLADVAGNELEEFTETDRLVKAVVVTTQITTAGAITVDTTLEFSEELGTSSKTAVKAIVDAALTATGDATVTTSWTGATLTVDVTLNTGTVNLAVLNVPASFTVTGVSGNVSATLTVADLQN